MVNIWEDLLGVGWVPIRAIVGFMSPPQIIRAQ